MLTYTFPNCWTKNSFFGQLDSLFKLINQCQRWQPLQEALANYEQRRNEVAMPIYEVNSQFATQEPPSAEMQLLFQALRTNQVEMDYFLAALEGTISPAEFFAPENVTRIIGAAKLQA